MALAHFRMLIHELLDEDPDMVPKDAPLIVLDSKSAMWVWLRMVGIPNIPDILQEECIFKGMERSARCTRHL